LTKRALKRTLPKAKPRPSSPVFDRPMGVGPEDGEPGERRWTGPATTGSASPRGGWSPMGGEDEREQGYLKTVKAKSDGQAELLAALDSRSLVLALGPAGTGKTYLAIAKAVEALEAGRVGRIVLSRPAVDAGENIGFLPGDMEDKLAPYLRPLYDALSDRLSMKRVRALMAEGLIEIAPVGYMRGRTLNNAFVVIDEAQNCTYVQLKMLLTRLGWHSTMVVTGDPNQSDLLPGISGWRTWRTGWSVCPTSPWCGWPSKTSCVTRSSRACWACSDRRPKRPDRPPFA
jgi:phosphate starvation-inducible PhoH-like protein